MDKVANGYLHLASDCDGPLLVDLTRDWFEWVNQTRGLSWDYSIYALTGRWDKATVGFDHGTRNRLYAEFRQSTSFRPDVPTPGAREALARMPRSKCALVTLRTIETRPLTESALKDVAGFNHYFFGVERKFRVLREIGTHLYVEDSVREAKHAVHAMPHIRVMLFPTRGVQRLSVRHPRVIIPQAEHWNTRGISDQRWEDVCHSTWQETVEVAHALVEDI